MGGLLVSAGGLLILWLRFNRPRPFWFAMAGMVMQSTGIGLFNAPNNSSILSAVEPSKFGVISGFLNLVRNAGNLCSIAIATAIVTATMGSLGYEPSLAGVTSEGSEGLLSAFTSGLRVAYSIMAFVVLAGVIASAFKGPRYQTGPGGSRCPSCPDIRARPRSDRRPTRSLFDSRITLQYAE